MTSPDKKIIKLYVTPEEYEAAKNLAKLSGVSLSRLGAILCSKKQLQSKEDSNAILQLEKISADLGRLGGLLKLGLGGKQLDREQANSLLESINKTRALLESKIDSI